MVEHPRDALADGQAQVAFVVDADAFRERVVEAAEFLEDPGEVMFGNARAGVPHLAFDPLAAMAQPQQHAAFAGVPQSVSEEILQRATQQAAVAPHEHRRTARPGARP